MFLFVSNGTLLFCIFKFSTESFLFPCIVYCRHVFHGMSLLEGRRKHQLRTITSGMIWQSYICTDQTAMRVLKEVKDSKILPVFYTCASSDTHVLTSFGSLFLLLVLFKIQVIKFTALIFRPSLWTP